MSRAHAVLFVLGAAAVLLLLIAVWTARRTRTIEDFHLAGSSLGVLRGGLSSVASAYSFWVLIGVSAGAFTLGWSAIWIAIGIGVGAAFAWFILGPALKRASSARNAKTAFELIGGSSDPDKAGASLSVVSICAVAVLFGIVAQLGFAGATIAHGLGVNSSVGVAIVAALALIGPVLGGLRATSGSGLVLALVVMPVVVMLPMSSFIFVGGLDQLRSGLATTGPEAAAWFGGRGIMDTLILLLAAAGIGAGICGQPQVLDQFVAMRSERTVRWSGVIAIVWLAVVLVAMLLLGWAARVVYASIDNTDTVMFEAVERLMAPSFLVLPITAIVAVVICTVGSQLVVVCDALLLLPRRQGGAAAPLSRHRLLVLLAGIAAAVIAAFGGIGSSRGFLLAWLATAAAIGPLVLMHCAGFQIRQGWAAAATRIGVALALVLFLLRTERAVELAMFLPFYAALAVALIGRSRKPRAPR